MDNIEKNTLFRVRTTLFEMLEDRHYNVPETIKNINMEDFNVMYDKKNLSISINGEENNNPYDIYVYFQLDDKSFGKNDLKKLVSSVFELNNNTTTLIIIVLKDKPVNTVMEEYTNQIYNNTELFERKHLLFNITKHYLVPKHILLTKEEGEKVLEDWNCKFSQLPQMQYNDPQAKYYGMKRGDICKIIRYDQRNGESFSYRAVV